MHPLTAILIGAGNRGAWYTDLMKKLDGKYRVAAVAEPVQSRRDDIQSKHVIPAERCFASWEPLLALGKIADVALICTMDQQHLAPRWKPSTWVMISCWKNRYPPAPKSA